MQQGVQRARETILRPIIEAMSHPPSKPVNLGVEWASRREEFFTSVQDFFMGPRPAKNEEEGTSADSLQVDFVGRRLPLGGFLASCIWHVLAIWLLILPIWGFLPKVQPTLQTPQIELTWYTTPEDLPKILLPSSSLKSALPAAKPKIAAIPAPRGSAETFHPRQTILSVPVRATHPRQTLIQPKTPPEPPKIAPDLPNVVLWDAGELPKLQLQLSASRAVPRIPRREMESMAAPRIPDSKDNGARLDLLSTQAPKQLAIPLSPPTSRAAKRRTPSQSTSVPAPDISEASGNSMNVRQMIALSAMPALAPPKAIVPSGNLAAHIAISPKGRKSGSSSDEGTRRGAMNSAMKGGGKLPAAISISRAIPQTRNGVRAGAFRRDLGLTPFSRTEVPSPRPSEPTRIDVAKISSSLPPEAVFSGRHIYTMNVSMPNVTSASGSWILNFAELEAADDTPMHRMGVLSGPEPLIKVDPRYPPDMIRQHVQGEVVLYAIIRKNGTVDSIRVMRSLDPQLDRTAAAALAQWKFRPGTRDGVPVDIEAVVHIPFNYTVPKQ